MDLSILNKTVTVVDPKNLYKWANIWGKIQKNYYTDPVYLRREKQIEDFIKLNEFKKIYLEKDTDILKTIISVETPSAADLVVITDQKFSRLPCVGIIEEINRLLSLCPRLYLCLNRHYINIDDTFCDSTLSDSFTLAITQWLKKELDAKILDLSLDYIDRGDYFTWVVPDRMYYIEKL
jgi:hypothetical protein